MQPKDDSYYQNSRSELEFLIPRNVRKIFEVGCGDGAFRKYLPEQAEYIGVEPNTKSAEIARTICDKVLVGFFEDIECEIPENYFELAVANDVIEHSLDHNKFIRLIGAKLKEGSYFIGSIPNVRSFELLYNLLIKKDWKYTESGILDYTHLRFFTQLSLERALKDGGFIDIVITPINKISPNGKIKPVKSLIINIIKFLFGSDIGYAQLAFSCKKGL